MKYTYEQVKKDVIDIAEFKIGFATEAYNMTDVINNMDADSLDKVEFIMELEKNFGFSISDEDVERLWAGSLDGVIDYVCGRLGVQKIKQQLNQNVRNDVKSAQQIPITINVGTYEIKFVRGDNVLPTSADSVKSFIRLLQEALRQQQK